MEDVVYKLSTLGNGNGRIDITLHVLEGRNYLNLVCYNPSKPADGTIYVSTDLDELRQLSQLATFAARKARASSTQYVYVSDDKEAKILHDQASKLLGSGQHDLAVAKFQELIKRYPNNAWADRANEKLSTLNTE